MTRFRCGGIFNNSFIANFQEIVKVKNFENRSVFDEVTLKILLVRFFSGHGAYEFETCFLVSVSAYDQSRCFC